MFSQYWKNNGKAGGSALEHHSLIGGKSLGRPLQIGGPTVRAARSCVCVHCTCLWGFLNELPTLDMESLCVKTGFLASLTPTQAFPVWRQAAEASASRSPSKRLYPAFEFMHLVCGRTKGDCLRIRDGAFLGTFRNSKHTVFLSKRNYVGLT